MWVYHHNTVAHRGLITEELWRWLMELASLWARYMDKGSFNKYNQKKPMLNNQELKEAAPK